MWTISVPWQDSLEARITAKTDEWFQTVRLATEQEETAARLARLKETATDDAVRDLAEIVAELLDAVAEMSTMIV